ncbi:KTSC domain-containing protein [Olivibacter sp. XZL3]|uniref:KTSC domain-containing protein n=1 Tax=Olivibacter sp. XZL3 TaxID=1735116 RepID=UPI00106604AF|nr:KTSC domain-containing protein [Olivibacter sp. XZL3]
MPSTVIASVHYSADTEVLQIIFTTGRIYFYYDVPPTVYEKLIHARSKGSFFNKEIRGRFAFKEKES